MAIKDDFSINAAKDIRYVGSATTYTVLAFHRFLQDMADRAGSDSDDILDISRADPSARSTDNIITLLNGYNIDDTAAEHLYDGSIAQEAGQTLYSGLVVLGSVNSGTTELEIIQDGAPLTNYWGTGLNASGQNLLRIMIKTKSGGSTIDGGRVTVQAKELGDTYASFTSTLALGNGVAAISTTADLNNQTASATIAGWAADFTNTEGLNSIDVNNDSVNEQYYSQWNLASSRTVNDLYEFAKWATRRGSTETLYGLTGSAFKGITHTIASADNAGLAAPELVTFSNGATAQLLAVSTGGLQVQLLTGVAPSASDTYTSTAGTGTVDSVVARTVQSVFIGSSTGTSLIGGFGVGVAVEDLKNADQVFDLTNTLVSVPNNVQFQVAGLVVGEDRILVGPENGGDLQVDQLSAVAGIPADTAFVVNEAIPLDTPVSGTIRVFDGSTYARVEYASYSGSTFTLVSTLGVTVAGSANVFVSYIDKVAGLVTEKFTSVYNSPRSLFLRIRDGGGTPIKPFESTGTLGSAGGSATVIRTSDL